MILPEAIPNGELTPVVNTRGETVGFLYPSTQNDGVIFMTPGARPRVNVALDGDGIIVVVADAKEFNRVSVFREASGKIGIFLNDNEGRQRWNITLTEDGHPCCIPIHPDGSAT